MRQEATNGFRDHALAEPAANALCVLEGASAGYGGKVILKEISLTLIKSEIFVLMGPNGAGKSSLVRLLTGSLKPQSGTLSFPGCNTSNPAQSIRLVPQEIALYPWLTARENCIAFSKINGSSWKDAHKLADKALALCRCEDIAGVQIAHLSGGFKRRVNIAAALIGDPLLLILDEPTAGIDLEAKNAIAQTILSLQAAGLGIFIITHDFNDADALASRAGFLFEGKLVCTGKPKDLSAAVFGSKKRIEINLAARPGAIQQQALHQIGACPLFDTLAWVFYRAFEDWNAREIFAPLQELGLHVSEYKFREPGLEDVYLNLSGAIL